MKSFRALMLVSMSILAACNGAATDGSATTNNAVTEADQGKMPMPRGPEALLFAALHESIDLTDAQRTTIHGLVGAMRPKGPPDISALAAAVRAGKVDPAALAPADLAEHRTVVIAALTTLHHTLTGTQRSALVGAIQKHAAEAPPPPPDARRILEGLDVTPDQQTAIKAALDASKSTVDPETMRKEIDAKLAMFAADTFDATAFMPDKAPPPDPMLAQLAVIVPLLTPTQRNALASRIEAGPPPSGK